MERTSSTALRLEFTGSASEYFRIWIVNLALSILTLGIYSAWAKVRRLKYLYGHTRLKNASFDYRGDPLTILKGRAIAFAAFFAYSLASNVSPMAGALFALVILFSVPWLIVRALRFKARNSAYRGLRFDFTGTWGKATLPFGAYFFLITLSLGLATPFVIAEQRRFVYNHFQFGKTRFSLNVDTGQFYRIFMQASLPLLIILAALAGVIAAWPPQGTEPTRELGLAVITLMIVYIPALAAMTTLIQTGLGNLIWNNLNLGGHRFRSELRFGRLLLINLTNSLAILFTFGLMYPWATIRSTRYRLESLSVIPAGEMDEFVATESAAVQAAGEELADVLDIDIGL